MSDLGYYERRLRLWRVLRGCDCATAAQLAVLLGWELREVSAKLQSLHRDGMADRSDERHNRTWWVA